MKPNEIAIEEKEKVPEFLPTDLKAVEYLWEHCSF
jgi:hypothetical protein